jgi:dihydrofolate reductase
MIKLIAAVEYETYGIGYGNSLPWPIVVEDLKHFRNTTIGKTVVMGANTFLSLGELPLPGRKNVVITRKKRNHYPKEVIQVHHPEQVLKWKEDVYVIGGASIYAQFIPYASRLIITELSFHRNKVKLRFDRYFPRIDMKEWDTRKRTDWLESVSGTTYRIATYGRSKK